MTEQGPRRVATVIWAALLAGSSMFLGVALYLVFGLRGGVGLARAPLDERLAIGGAAALSVVTVAASWLWAVRMKITSQAGVRVRGGAAFPPGPESNAITRLIVACALCEGSALAAVVVFMLTGSTAALGPCALSWLALAAHFPGERHWAQLVGRPGGAPGNPMIRG